MPINKKLILKERDYTILRLVYEFRFLSGALLWYLLRIEDQSQSTSHGIGQDGKRRPSKYGFGRQALSKRLKQLFDAAYLERHYLTDQAMGRGHGMPRAIYGLGDKSPNILSELNEIPVKETKRIIESNRVKSPFLRHALEVAEFRVILKLACDKSNGNLELQFWEQGNSIKDSVNGYVNRGNKERFVIHADAFFAIRLNNKKSKHFFLEIDRGTEPIVSHSKRSNIRRKLRGYQHYFKSKKISKKYATDINGFQVLIVTPGIFCDDGTMKGRVANIYNEVEANRDLYPSTSLFLLTVTQNLNLSEPETVLSRIWVSMKSNTSLLSLFE